jgi:glycosyltransferase involved in cell wall biosynthesis
MNNLHSSKKIGLIVAVPNAHLLPFNSNLYSATIKWIAAGVDSVEVRVNKPDGSLLSRSGCIGIAETGSWVHDGMTFYLQDVSDGNPLTIENTLSVVPIRRTIDPLSIFPDLPHFVAYLGHRFGCGHILAIGSLLVDQLAGIKPKFEITVIESAKNIEAYKKHYAIINWIEGDFIQPDFKITIPDQVLKTSIVIYATTSENISDSMLNVLKNIMVHTPICVVSTCSHNILTPNQMHINKLEPRHEILRDHLNLKAVLKSKGLYVIFEGSAAGTVVDFEKTASVAVIAKTPHERINIYQPGAPSNFRVVAIISAYNEEDIIIPSLQYLIDQGIEVYLIDNWSTDNTAALAEQLIGRGLLGIEKFPEDHQSSTYAWESLLKRKEELAREIQADWFIHHDVDEIRESPWPDIRLKDAIYLVDQSGFNCIDHSVIEFNPIDDEFTPGSDFRAYFKHFEFGRQPADFIRSNAWKNSGQVVSLAETGGHEVHFEGRRIYPYKFLLRHYRIRSQAQAEKKIFKDRIARWDPREKARGWHSHYDKIEQGYNFICSSADLEFFDEAEFYKKYLTERLSGVGVARADFVSRKDCLDIPHQHLTNQVDELSKRNIQLKSKIAELESYQLSLSRKWWIRCIVYFNRLLGKKHRLDRPFEPNSRT